MDNVANHDGEDSASIESKGQGPKMRTSDVSRWQRGFGQQTMERLGSLTLFIVACALLAFYLFFTYRIQMHSDSAMKLLLGEQMALQHTLFPRDWYYINDIPILFPSLIAAPLLLFFEPSMMLHSVVGAIVAALVLWAAYAASRIVGIKGGLRLFVPTMLASGLSLPFVEMAFGQAAYSGVLFTLMLLAAAGSRVFVDCTELPGQRRIKHLAIVAVLVVLGVAAGPRGITTYTVPLLVASAAMWLLPSSEPQARRAALRLLLVSLGATLLGGLMFLLEMKTLRYASAATSQTFASPEAAGVHLRLIAMNWLDNFDALPPSGQKATPLATAIYAMRLTLAAVVFFLPLVLLFRVHRIKSIALRFLVLFHIALLASTIYLLVFTGLLVDADHGVPRYLTPLVPTALLIIALWLQESGSQLRLRPVLIGWIMLLVALSLSPWQLVGSAFAQWPRLSAGLRANPRTELVDLLERAGLYRGYGGYWDASVVSVLSGGRVRVAPILLDGNGIPIPYRWLGSERWYDETWAGDSGFLVLDPALRTQINMPALEAMLGTPTKTLRAGGLEILVFKANISKQLGFPPTQSMQQRATPKALCPAQYRMDQTALTLSPGQRGVVVLHATNRSDERWERVSNPGFNPGLRVVAEDGKTVGDLRGVLTHAVPAGGSVDIPIAFQAPATPGHYTLYSSFVAEGETWCGDMDHNWAQASLTIQP